MNSALVLRNDPVLVRLTRARQALAEARTMQAAKQIADVAAAARVYARQQQLGQDAIAFAQAVQFEAMRRLGQLSKAAPKNKGALRRGTRREPRGPEPTLRELGVTKKQSSLANFLADLPTEKFNAVRDGRVKVGQARREQRHEYARAVVPTLPKPVGVFEVLVVDPPWRYDRQPADAGLRGEVDYATMSMEELRALRLPVAADCVLWLWTTNSFMREAYELLAAWDFQAKTILTWDKVNFGLGEWLRNVTEHCILAVRGRPRVTLTNQTTLLREPRRQHSQKPEAFYALVEQLCVGRRCEYFSRTPRPGWEAYGLEAHREQQHAIASLR